MSRTCTVPPRAPRWAGAGLVLLLALAGCGGAPASGPTAAAPAMSPATSPATPPATPPATSPAAAVRVVEIGVSDRRVATSLDRVELAVGATVRLVVTSDVADEVHVHGYEHELALPAGRPAELEFVVDQPGLFEVETHDSQLLLVQLLVR